MIVFVGRIAPIHARQRIGKVTALLLFGAPCASSLLMFSRHWKFGRINRCVGKNLLVRRQARPIVSEWLINEPSTTAMLPATAIAWGRGGPRSSIKAAWSLYLCDLSLSSVPRVVGCLCQLGQEGKERRR